MIRPAIKSLMTLVLLLGTATSLLAADVTDAAMPTETAIGTLEDAYAAWTASLVDDGSWSLQMPSTREVEDLDLLTATLLEDPRGSDLNPGRKAGYLVALADRTALEGHRDRARSLYQLLGTSQVSLLQMWSVYMLAGLDFAEGRYDRAATGYDRVCSESAPADWRDHACTMVGLAQRLDTIELEGGDHGDPVTSAP